MNVLTLTLMSTALVLIALGIFMLVMTSNMIRVVLAVEVMMKAVTLLLIYAGQINGQLGLTQTFIVTQIVIEIVLAAVASGLVINIYRKTGQRELRRLNKLNG
ncbi:MAG: NADH-quinone oxidoreductase subunit K [Firmicutes bacterium]|nr:NADH-quinone oxidoreductase subunit K [Bacillota bacterium]MBQ6607095.1 NADH-quinone oxidoreductase subunit K [Bacillota bacterium]MBR0179746.1 NADH-quinone oxidoreductase subunit K [Bacillota bacterium]